MSSSAAAAGGAGSADGGSASTCTLPLPSSLPADVVGRIEGFGAILTPMRPAFMVALWGEANASTKFRRLLLIRKPEAAGETKDEWICELHEAFTEPKTATHTFVTMHGEKKARAFIAAFHRAPWLASNVSRLAGTVLTADDRDRAVRWVEDDSLVAPGHFSFFKDPHCGAPTEYLRFKENMERALDLFFLLFGLANTAQGAP